MVLRGPPSLVLQFFRHYGHPQRDRVREVLQLAVVCAFILLFPVGLLCSTMWMPVGVQYAWLSWQLYVVLALHVSRYSNVGVLASTESGAAEAFSRQLARQTGARRNASILLGHAASGRDVLRVDLTVSYHRRNQEGRDIVKDMLRADVENGFGISPVSTISSANSSDTMLPEKGFQ